MTEHRKDKTRLLSCLCMAAVIAMAVIMMSACGSESKDGTDSAGTADTSVDVGALYAQEIAKDLNHPNYYFEYDFMNGHVLTYDGDEDGVPEFVELGVGYNIPQCILVYRYSDGEVIRIPEKPEDVMAYTEPAGCYTSVYFNDAADRFCFFSEEAHGDCRLFSDYQFDSSGDYTLNQRGTQHFGTGAEGTGSKGYSADSDAVAAMNEAEQTMLTVKWNTGNTYPDNFHIHICSNIDEMRTALAEEGISVDEDSSAGETSEDTYTAEDTYTSNDTYTDEELVQMAKTYYESVSGDVPPIVEVDSVNGDEVTIHLYEDMGDHTATMDWYTVNRNTLKGYNVLGDDIDLSTVQ